MLSRSLMGTLLKLARERRPGGPGGAAGQRTGGPWDPEHVGKGHWGPDVGLGLWVLGPKGCSSQIQLGYWEQMWGSWEGLLLTLDLPQAAGGAAAGP